MGKVDPTTVVNDDDQPASNEETDAVMTAITGWLDHWQDVLTGRDGPAHVPAFVSSMQELCYQLLEILAAHGGIDDEDEDDTEIASLGTRH